MILNAQFVCTNGFYSVRRHFCFPSSVHSLRATNVFILFTMYDSQCAVCVHLRFLFCLSPHLFSEWHIVPQLCIQIKQSRVYSRKALAGCKASRRLGKQIRGLSRFLSKPPKNEPNLFNDVPFSQDVPLVCVTTHSTTLPYNHPR